MQFEILNTIMFLVGVSLGAVIYYQIKVRTALGLKWRYFALGVLCVAGFSHQTFYTLTEKQDSYKTQAIMKTQKDNFNSTEINEYLDKASKEVVQYGDNNLTLEEELLLQQSKSKALADTIDKGEK